MTSEVSRSIRIARVITQYTNPSILSILLLVLIAFTKSDTLLKSLGSVLLIFIFYVSIPFIYLYVRNTLSGQPFKSILELISFLKQHPGDILVLAFFLGIPCFLILLFFNTPTILITAVAALVAGSIITALFNLFYRVSYHLTGITILVIMAAQAWGQVYLVFIILIPLVFWAKYHIREHTLPQLMIGMTVSVVVSLAAIKLCG